MTDAQNAQNAPTLETLFAEPTARASKKDVAYLTVKTKAPLPVHPEDPNTDLNIAEVWPKIQKSHKVPFTATGLSMAHLGGAGGPVRRRPRTIVKVLAILEASGHVVKA